MEPFHKRFSDTMSGIQHIVVSVGVVIGALWALFVFSAEQRVRNAELELESLQLSLDRAPAFGVEIGANLLPGASDVGSVLLVSVTVENVGIRDGELIVGKDPIRAAVISDVHEGTMVFGKAYSTNIYSSTASGGVPQIVDVIVSRVGDKNTYYSLIEVDEPGVYFVEFSAVLLAGGDGVSRPTVWTAQYIAVAESGGAVSSER